MNPRRPEMHDAVGHVAWSGAVRRHQDHQLAEPWAANLDSEVITKKKIPRSGSQSLMNLCQMLRGNSPRIFNPRFRNIFLTNALRRSLHPGRESSERRFKTIEVNYMRSHSAEMRPMLHYGKLTMAERKTASAPIVPPRRQPRRVNDRPSERGDVRLGIGGRPGEKQKGGAFLHCSTFSKRWTVRSKSVHGNIDSDISD